MGDMVKESTWDEFRKSGLLWWVNRTLHLFGWSIVVTVSEGRVERAYPARVRFRGFDAKTETKGFQQLTQHIQEEMERLQKDVQEEGP